MARTATSLLVTLGLSIVIENLLLAAFSSDTRTIDTPYGFSPSISASSSCRLPRAIAFGVSCAIGAGALGVARAHRHRQGDPRGGQGAHGRGAGRHRLAAYFAVTFGLSAACLAVAACVLLPSLLRATRASATTYVLVAFTIVVLGGMGSVPGAMIGGLLIGVVESLSGLYFGESLGQLGVFLIFILVLLLRPTGLFGATA